ncbi:MAG: hypothetical protein HYY84_13125 [Deltaproteobacteria bacterium]|nr:hypothetical protein [Deltaproteobacteria bacterium]
MSLHSRFLYLMDEPAAGSEHLCWIAEDTQTRASQVLCLGENACGQLGVANRTFARDPVAMTGIVDAVQIATGNQHTCVLRANGTVHCAGCNKNGELGVAPSAGGHLPTAVPGVTDAVEIVSGAAHTCANRSNGEILCWGRNDRGQLGDFPATERRPTRVRGLPALPGNRAFRALAAGKNHTCVQTLARTVWCWGANEFGQLGHGTTSNNTTPVRVTDVKNVLNVASGPQSDHTCATVLGENGDNVLLCWGRNDHGQVGDGTVTSRPSPVRVREIAGGARGFALGPEHTCVIRDFKGFPVWCWGANAGRELSPNATRSPHPPIVVPELPYIRGIVGGPSRGTTILTNNNEPTGWANWWNLYRAQHDRPHPSFQLKAASKHVWLHAPFLAEGYSHDENREEPERRGVCQLRVPSVGKHLLEICSYRQIAPRATDGGIDLQRAVPPIGAITATTFDRIETEPVRTLYWFRQISSVFHTPMRATGFLVPYDAVQRYLVVRIVASEANIKKTDGALEHWRWSGSLIVR